MSSVNIYVTNPAFVDSSSSMRRRRDVVPPLRREGNTSDKNFSCKSAWCIRLNGRVSGMQERARDDIRERVALPIRVADRSGKIKREKARRENGGKQETQKQDMIHELEETAVSVPGSLLFFPSFPRLSLLLLYFLYFRFRSLLFFRSNLFCFISTLLSLASAETKRHENCTGSYEDRLISPRKQYDFIFTRVSIESASPIFCRFSPHRLECSNCASSCERRTRGLHLSDSTRREIHRVAREKMQFGF